MRHLPRSYWDAHERVSVSHVDDSDEKRVWGLMDSRRLARDPDAYRILEHTTDTALPHLPGKAIEHGKVWRPKKDETYTQDESYTIPENLFLAYQRGAGKRYRT